MTEPAFENYSFTLSCTDRDRESKLPGSVHRLVVKCLRDYSFGGLPRLNCTSRIIVIFSYKNSDRRRACKAAAAVLKFETSTEAVSRPDLASDHQISRSHRWSLFASHFQVTKYVWIVDSKVLLELPRSDCSLFSIIIKMSGVGGRASVF